jgi:hypothetical protein
VVGSGKLVSIDGAGTHVPLEGYGVKNAGNSVMDAVRSPLDVQRNLAKRNTVI